MPKLDDKDYAPAIVDLGGGQVGWSVYAFSDPCESNVCGEDEVLDQMTAALHDEGFDYEDALARADAVVDAYFATRARDG